MNPDLSAIQLPNIASPGSTPSPAVTGSLAPASLSALTVTQTPDYSKLAGPYGGSSATKPAQAPTVAPTVISSAPAEKKVAADTATLAQAETQMQGTSAVSAPNRVFRVGSALYNADTNKPLTAAEANAVIAKAGGDLNRIAPGELPATAVDEAIAGTDGATTTTPTREKTAAEIGLESSMVQLSQLKEQMDATSKAYINSIEREYDTIIKQQELANKAFEGGVTVEGIRSGRARYAPVMQYSLLNEAVSAGIGKIAALNSKKQSLIIQAQQARDENNFKMLSKTMDIYRETIKEERQAAKDAAEAVYKAAEEARAAAKASYDRINFETNYSETVSPYLADVVADMGEDEAYDFMESAAKNLGVDPNILIGQVTKYNQNIKKSEQTAVLDLSKKYLSAGIEAGDDFDTAIEKARASDEYRRDIIKAEADIANTMSIAKNRALDNELDWSDPVLSIYAAATNNVVTSPSQARGIIGYADNLLFGKEVVSDDYSGELLENQIKASDAQKLVYDAFSQLRLPGAEQASQAAMWQYTATPEYQGMSDAEKAQTIRSRGLNPEDFGIYE